MNVLLLFALVIISLSSSSQESPRHSKTPSSQAHPVVPAQEFNATGTSELETINIETLCMIGVVIVLFLIFAGIAAVQEYKSRKSFKLVDNQNRVEVELVSMRAIENGIEETTV